jgi:uncharacterized tellurite resistance protein B-like protein
LDLFSRSVTYHQLMGRSAADARFHRLMGKSGKLLSEAELEREALGIMGLMDPSFLRNDPETGPLLRELLALAGMAVALADGSVARGERKALGSLVGKRGLIESAEKLMRLSPQDHATKLQDLAETVKLHLSPLACQKVVEDLVAIALADRRLEQTEVEAVAKVAGYLGVRWEFVEQALARALSGLD